MALCTNWGGTADERDNKYAAAAERGNKYQVLGLLVRRIGRDVAAHQLEQSRRRISGAELGALEAHVAVAPAALSVGALGAAGRSRTL